MNSVTDSSYPFLPLITYRYQLKDLLLLCFFKAAFHANPGVVKKRAGLSS